MVTLLPLAKFSAANKRVCPDEEGSEGREEEREHGFYSMLESVYERNASIKILWQIFSHSGTERPPYQWLHQNMPMDCVIAFAFFKSLWECKRVAWALVELFIVYDSCCFAPCLYSKTMLFHDYSASRLRGRSRTYPLTELTRYLLHYL